MLEAKAHSPEDESQALLGHRSLTLDVKDGRSSLRSPEDESQTLSHRALTGGVELIYPIRNLYYFFGSLCSNQKRG